MTFESLLRELGKRSIELRRNKNELEFRGSKDTIDDNILQQLRSHKSELLEWMEDDANDWHTPHPIIVPDMLPLITLNQEEIDIIIESTPGGAGNIQDIYPLAPLQEGILFHHLVNEERDAYIISSLMAFDNRELLDNFLRAFQSVIDRHDIFRTAILWEDLSEPVQVVWRNAGMSVEEVMIDPSEGNILDQMVERYAAGKVPIDICRAPMILAFTAWDRNTGRWILALLFHHLIIDHATVEILFEEIKAYLTDGESILPEALPFRNYVAQARLGINQEEHEAYFRKMLFDIEEPTAPYGMLDVRGDGSDIEEAWYTIDTYLSLRLRDCARKLRVSAASIFHLAWARVLGSLSDRDDVVFGTVIFGRTHGGEGVERVMGLFINTLPVRIEVKEDGVEEAIKKTHHILTDLFHHEHATLALAQRCSGVVSPTPLFSSLLNYRYIKTILAEGVENKGWGMGIEVLYSKERTNYPFTLSVNDMGEGYSLTSKVKKPIDPKQVCRYMNTVLEHLADALESAPLMTVGSIDVLTETELIQLLYEWNDTNAEYPNDKCIHELYEEQVEKTPDAIAIVFEDKQISYREMNLRINQLANYLVSLGVKHDNPVGIYIDRSLEMVIGLYGILKAGGAYVPLDPQYPDYRLWYMLSNSKVTVVLTQRKLRNRFFKIISEVSSDNKPSLVCLDSDWDAISKEKEGIPGVPLLNQSLAYVSYTSGSTGDPKGVMISHKGICNLLLWMQDEIQLNYEDCIFQTTTFSFDASVWEFFWPLQAGAKLVIAEPEGHKDIKYLVQTIMEQNITTLHFVPSMLSVFLEEEDIKICNSLRRVFCGGEALSYKLQKCYYSILNTSLYNLYGPTETSVFVTYWACNQDDNNKTVYIGRPITNTRMYIIDSHMQPVPIIAQGEFYIGGVQLSRGYIFRPDLTAEKFIPNPFDSKFGDRLYKTGDLGRYSDDGKISYISRIDNQVKIRGFRIELGEVESQLTDIDGINEAVVLVREDMPGDKRLVAYYTLMDDSENMTSDEVRSHLSNRLPDYMIPSAYVELEEIPFTLNGKVDRKSFPKPERESYASGGYEAPVGEVEEILSGIWSEVLNIEQVGRNDNFFDLGGHSLLMIQVLRKIKKKIKKEIKIVDLFTYPNIKLLSKYLNSEMDHHQNNIERNLTIIKSEKYEPIAIIGMICRFPGIRNTEEFWQSLRDGKEVISRFTDEELMSDGVEPSLLDNPAYVKVGALLDDIDMFDASFFGFSPRHAEITNPQHRIFLECVYEALEQSGYINKKRVGVFAGSALNQYLNNNVILNSAVLENSDPFQVMISNGNDHLTTLASYKLNLDGPSVNIQTACSTSLVAVHFACKSLLDNECDLALAGGITVNMFQKRGYVHKEGGILSSDGHCRAFDSRADGTAPGNGIGIVVLKRLKDAVVDRDNIIAVIKGSAINNDGSLKVGYTAPSVDGQSSVIRQALAHANLSSDTISYIEAHGTGTILGDPIEIEALNQAFREDTDRKGFCAIGSVKTNIGHTDTAAGVVGLIKTALALKHKQIPASLHFNKSNPEIDFENSPFYVNTELREWKNNANPRRAGVSSFGIGGTNAHVILEEAPSESYSDFNSERITRPYHLISLSAKTSNALEKLNGNLFEHLRKHPDLNISDVAYSLHVGRESFDYRRILVCHDRDEALDLLRKDVSKKGITCHKKSERQNIAFMFSGQGAQYINMGLDLYNSEKGFRNDIDFCSELLEPQLGFDLRKIMFPVDDDLGGVSEQLKQTAITQPALFILEYALARLFISWGIRPSAMIGHSIGEYTAACLSGVFSLEDCLKLVALRGRLIQELPEGNMLAVALSEEELEPLLGNGLSIAAVNRTDLCTVSGPNDEIELFKEIMDRKRVPCIALHTSHAFHSKVMEPILKEYADHVKKIDRKIPRIPFISNITGTWITEKEATDPDYWARHIRHTVRFADGIKGLLKDENQVLLEVGPGQTLKTLVMQHPDLKAGQVILSSIRSPRETTSDMSFLLTTLGRLWVEGVKVDWPEFYRHEEHRRVPLPTYPFERKRYWIDAKSISEEVFKSKEGLSISTDVDHWFYIPSWKRTIPPTQFSKKSLTDKKLSWIVFLDEIGVGSSIVKRLKQAGQDVTSIIIGKEFHKSKKNEYSFNPSQTEDYNVLLKEIQTQDKFPDRIIHCWNITNINNRELALELVNSSQDTGFYSLLFLSQALGDQYFNDEIQIVVLSNNMQEVIGEDLLYPEKTTLLGPIRVIPKEYPNISCKSIDVVVPQLNSWQGEKLIDLIMSEITDNSLNSIIAYRGNQRWKEDFCEIRMEDQYERSPRLKEDGVYLITGGLGSMGLAFAKNIAQKTRVKIVLTSRTELPPKDKWEEWLSGNYMPNYTGYMMTEKKLKNLNVDMEKEKKYIDKMERGISDRLGIKGLESYRGLEKSLNKLCSSYISRFFFQSYLKIEKGKIYDKRDLFFELEILPAFEKFYDFFIRTLAEDNILEIEGNKIKFLKEEKDIKRPDILQNEINERFPGFKGLLDLLDHCADNYGTALREEMKAISVLYPDGSNKLMEEYVKNTVVHTNESIYLILVREIFKTVIKRIKKRKLRILEVGAGGGALTRILLEELKIQDIEYCFTDIGKAFINNARKDPLIGSLDFMEFKIFDISKDPEGQGYEKFSFDIILGYNVVHVTPVIEDTIRNLKNIMTPDGILFLIEPVKSRRWNDMIWGLAEGWWNFNDEDLRKESPLLCLDDWEEVLRKEGFKSVRGYPQDSQRRNNSSSGLIIAQRDPESCMNDHAEHVFFTKKDKIEKKILKLKELEDLGAEVIVASADVSNVEQMQSVISMTNERYGPIDGVIHTAGILGQGMIYRKTREETERTLAPKVKGTLILKSLLNDRNLDFFILCSSMSSIRPLPGQVDYCAANAFLDAFAFYDTNRHNTLTVSIDWGFWQELGMIETAEKPLLSKKMIEETIKKKGLSNAGVIAFDRILFGCEFPQVIVSPMDFRRTIEDTGPYMHVKGSHKSTSEHELYSRPDLNVAYEAPRNELEGVLAEIMQELFAIQKVGRMDDFFELGGDSLIVTQLISRLRDTIEVELHPRTVFENPNIAMLSNQIDSIQFEGVDDDILEEIISEVDSLTDLELAQKVFTEDN